MSRKRNGSVEPKPPRFSDYLADVEREESGQWVTLDPPLAHVRVLLRSPFCADYQKRLSKLMRERMEQNPSLETYEHMEILRQAIAEVALVSYEGLLEDDGEPIQHSDAFVRKLMLDRACHHYGDSILSAFQRLALVKRQEREAEGKESGISSDIGSLSLS